MSSVFKDTNGPDWPLGLVTVANAGTPVRLMVNVDPSNNWAPGTASPASNGSALPEYTVRANQILIQGVKLGANNSGVVNNAGNIYLMRRPTGNNTGNISDPGAMVAVIAPGQTLAFGSSAQVKDVFSPFRYFLDADNNNDSGLVTLLIF